MDVVLVEAVVEAMASETDGIAVEEAETAAGKVTVETVAETRPCPVCGRAFLPDGRQRDCSPTCARAARRQKQCGYMRKYRGRP